MRTPVCEICLKSGILCRSCSEKLKNGDVSENDVKVARLLLNLSGGKKNLKDVTLVKVAESADMAVIVCGKDDAAKFIGAGGKTVKMLEKELGKRVMVVEDAVDIRGFVTNLLKPVHVVSINKLYKNGEEMLRVITEKGRNQRISSQDFSDVMDVLYGKQAELVSD